MPVNPVDHDEERCVRIEQQVDVLQRRYEQLIGLTHHLITEQSAALELEPRSRQEWESEVDISARLRTISQELRTSRTTPVQKLQALKPPLKH